MDCPLQATHGQDGVVEWERGNAEDALKAARSLERSETMTMETRSKLSRVSSIPGVATWLRGAGKDIFHVVEWNAPSLWSCRGFKAAPHSAARAGPLAQDPCT